MIGGKHRGGSILLEAVWPTDRGMGFWREAKAISRFLPRKTQARRRPSIRLEP